jgi:lipopolysaccharide export system permease protein
MAIDTSKPYRKSSKTVSAGIPGISLMDRYLAKELTMPLLFGIGAFSSLGVTIGAVFDLIRQATDYGLPFGLVLQILLLLTPEFVAIAIPMAILFAALMTYSRLSGDSELIALRSSGVSIYRLVLPAVVISLILTGVTFAFNEAVVPASKYQASVLLDQAVKKDKPQFREKNILYQEFRSVKQPDGDRDKVLTRIFYAKQFDGQQMKGLTVLDFSQEGLNQIVASESAIWNQGQDTWDFFNGRIYLVAPDGSYRNIIKFEKQQLKLPRTPLDLAKTTRRDFREMNIAQLQDYLNLVSQSGDEQEVRKTYLRIHQKLSFPFFCVVSGLIGATLGTRPKRTGRGTSFAISLLVIFGYYVLIILGDYLGRFEILAPVVAAWLPTVFGLSAGGLLLFRSAR